MDPENIYDITCYEENYNTRDAEELIELREYAGALYAALAKKHMNSNYIPTIKTNANKKELEVIIYALREEMKRMAKIEKEGRASGDEKDITLEKIEMLMHDLELEGINLDRVPRVDERTDMRELRYVLRLLQIKADKIKYTDTMADAFKVLMCGLADVSKRVYGYSIDTSALWEDPAEKERKNREAFIKMGLYNYVTKK